ncbi:SDR family NAD(P)-dependent oxidoreductase [uncultured Sphingomonas sp.]|uniref:SDR family NAD(P)-dependent oxidoreductase n=1 Tax=uncultured Sphingomonas sp. TaxID=158754 RepID=UPI0035CC50AE
MSGMLTGRVAIVTGASAGLGRRFAVTLAAAGAAVVLVARREDELVALAAEIETAGGRALACPIDLTDASAVEPLFDAAERWAGTVDILVNNAAIADADYATRLSLETIDRVIALDFRAPFLLGVEAARRLIAAGAPGRIVNLSSVGAFHYAPTSAAALYCAVKAGILRMTETLAIEWARYGINVNAIAPGMFMSEMTAGFIDRVGDKVRERFPRGRFGQPADLDSTLLYLVDPRSHFVTGTCITVDDAQTSR